MRVLSNLTPFDPARPMLNFKGATVTDDITNDCTNVDCGTLTAGLTVTGGVTNIDSTAALTLGASTATSIVIGKNGQLYGFNGVTAAAIPTPAGYSTMQTAGATTNIFTNTATTGGIGSTQFTFGDVVASLKTIGLLKQ